MEGRIRRDQLQDKNGDGLALGKGAEAQNFVDSHFAGSTLCSYDSSSILFYLPTQASAISHAKNGVNLLTRLHEQSKGYGGTSTASDAVAGVDRRLASLARLCTLAMPARPDFPAPILCISPTYRSVSACIPLLGYRVDVRTGVQRYRRSVPASAAHRAGHHTA